MGGSEATTKKVARIEKDGKPWDPEARGREGGRGSKLEAETLT